MSGFRVTTVLLLASLSASACSDLHEINRPDGAAVPAPSNSSHEQAGAATYQVSITNLTLGQPFTPPLVTVHRRPTGIFTVGEAASFELKEIAENGNLGPMLETLADDRHVAATLVALSDPVPPLLPGATVEIEIRGERGAMYLSFASMLICTNDGFTGIDSLRLPKQVGEGITIHTAAYDAGTEVNTEDFADLVPPCPELSGITTEKAGAGASNPALAEGGVIHHHGGIQGGADLVPNLHGWTDPVARLTIERIQ